MKIKLEMFKQQNNYSTYTLCHPNYTHTLHIYVCVHAYVLSCIVQIEQVVHRRQKCNSSIRKNCTKFSTKLDFIPCNQAERKIQGAAAEWWGKEFHSIYLLFLFLVLFVLLLWILYAFFMCICVRLYACG